MQAPSLTLGVEEEYQIIDPKTRELTSYITQILEADHRFLEQVKPELHQSIVEVGTKVCRTPAEVRTELVNLRGAVMELAGRNGLKIAAAGTHPFSSWMKQEITPLERYLGVKEDMQDLAQRLLIFGTHVHIGIEDREFLIDALFRADSQGRRRRQRHQRRRGPGEDAIVWLERLLASGTIPSYRVEGARRIDPSDVDAYLAEHRDRGARARVR